MCLGQIERNIGHYKLTRNGINVSFTSICEFDYNRKKLKDARY